MKRVLAVLLVFCLWFSEAPTLASDWSEQANALRRSTAQVTIFDNFEVAGYCTAFSINNAKDYFLTADHCFGTYLTVGGNNAYVVWRDKASDLMVVTVPESGDVPSLRPAAQVRQGEEVAAYGYGYAFEQPMLRAGLVSIVDLEYEHEHFSVFGFSFVGGMSGGPVVGRDGRVVSVVQQGNEFIGMGRTLHELLSKTARFWEQRP